MELIETITIQEVASYLNYKNYRSVRKWLNHKGLAVFRLGKKICVKKCDFENTINMIITNDNNQVVIVDKYKPVGECESSFLNCLQKFK